MFQEIYDNDFSRSLKLEHSYSETQFHLGNGITWSYIFGTIMIMVCIFVWIILACPS